MIFNVLNVDHHIKGDQEWKNVLLEIRGNQYTVTCFPNFVDYHKLEKGKEVDGYIRRKGNYETLVDYGKFQRSWKDGESFLEFD